MAHFLTMRDRLAVAGTQHPWHFNETGSDGRTVMVGSNETADGETMREAALPWEPVKVPLFYAGAHAEDSNILYRSRDLRDSGAFAIVRNDGLGCLTRGKSVGSEYTPLLNRDLVKLGSLLTATGEARWHTLGSLLGGRHIFGALQAAGEVKVRKGGAVIDTIAPYLMLFHSHDGEHSIEAMFTTIKPVCHNTVTAARSGAAKAKIRHSSIAGDPEALAARITEILGLATSSFAEQEAVLNALAEIPMDRTGYAEFSIQMVTGEDDLEAAKAVYRNTPKGAPLTKLENKIDALHGTIENGLGLRELPDSAYKAAQGLAEFIDHQRGRSAKWRKLNKSLGLDSALFGDGAKAKTRGLELLLRRAGR